MSYLTRLTHDEKGITFLNYVEPMFKVFKRKLELE